MGDGSVLGIRQEEMFCCIVIIHNYVLVLSLLLTNCECWSLYSFAHKMRRWNFTW